MKLFIFLLAGFLNFACLADDADKAKAMELVEKLNNVNLKSNSQAEVAASYIDIASQLMRVTTRLANDAFDQKSPYLIEDRLQIIVGLKVNSDQLIHRLKAK